MAIAVQVVQRGVVTLPKALRDAYNIRTGDVYTVIDLGDGSFRIVPHQLKIDALADEIRTVLEQKGETLESMLRALRIQRERNVPKLFLDTSAFLAAFSRQRAAAGSPALPHRRVGRLPGAVSTAALMLDSAFMASWER